MKNIHVLPTKNYSPLVHSTNKYGGYFKSAHYSPMKEMGDSYQHIYITSDEEIKDVRPHKGKWQLEKGQILNKFPNYLTDLSECKLVILTTDPDLIKDGVQAIDDEFLEWFVKNPSCEEVEVEKKSYIEIKEISYEGDFQNVEYVNYKIIIPQGDVNFFQITVNAFEKSMNLNLEYIEEPKQETLEEIEKNIDREEWINFFKNNSKEEILEYLINYKFPL
jgi:hypothetical protein